ncbi:uncharacterized protein DFL_007903 [Arthrobotrys flagrans]|uniref:Nephrocystin 3-like N-terminal domain-containing protein n=1 Tax=Arthrobotrys flagrans TaxID=97331 RepID=A0A436ZX13_ARTFL|nr:hypothetical protein DFL_007903 [Arthrobotrys flagrans]
MAAARAMLDEVHEDLPNSSKDLNSYVFGAIGNHNVVMACLPCGIYGVTPAALVVSQMQSSFPSIRFYMMVGIGGGAPTMADIRLGDVVVGIPTGQCPGVVQHDRGKIVAGGHTQETGSLNRPPRGLLNVVSKLRAIHSTEESRICALLKETARRFPKEIGFMRPKANDVLFRAEYDHIDGNTDTCDYCDENEIVIRSSRETSNPVIHHGIIASGNTVIKDGKSRDLIAKRHGACCFEMGAAGVADVVECLVIRGICDYSDSHKNKRWQGYAAATAAAYAKELLLTLPTSEHPSPSLPNNATWPGAQRTMKMRTFAEESLEEYKVRSLRSLSFGGMDHRLHNIAPAHRNTCDWFFETETFLKWRDRDDVETFNGVLWIKGKPGAGKSILMKHTLLHCQEELPGHSVAAYFFSTRGEGLEKSRCGMLRSLIYQLCDNDSEVCHRFLEHFQDKEKKHGLSWEWQESELESILLGLVTLSTKPIVLLVDALDECDEPEVRKVVLFLERLASTAISCSKGSLNICLSSRHYPTISMIKKLELTIERIEEHNIDIAIYIEGNLRIEDYNIKSELRGKAEGVFMWIVLVVEMLNQAYDDGDIDAVWTELRELPPDLDAVFRILLDIDKPGENRTIFMLEFMLFAEGRLSAAELYYAVKSASEPKSLRRHNSSIITDKLIESFIINNSRGLIEVCTYSDEYPGGDYVYVQFIHKTVEDFLLRNKRLQTLYSQTAPDSESFGHGRIAFSCLEYISMRDLANEPPQEPRTDARVYFSENYPFLWYATRKVFRHAELATAGHKEILQRLLNNPELFQLLRNMHDILEEHVEQYGQDANLLYTLSFHGCPKLARTLLTLSPDHNVDINSRGGRHVTPLRAAVSITATEVIRMLLDAGADPSISGGNYFNALQTAVYQDHASDATATITCISMLIDAGADVNISGGEFGTALQAAAASLAITYGSYHTVIKVIQVLLDAGADVNVQGGRYGNALQAAANAGEVGGEYGNALQAVPRARVHYYKSGAIKEVVKMLLDAGADVNAQGGCYGNALRAICYRNDATGGSDDFAEIIKMLLEAGADVNAQAPDKKYSTALQAACKSGGYANDIIKLLLKEGADVNARSGRGASAVDAAFESSCECVRNPIYRKSDTISRSLDTLAILQMAGAVGAAEARQNLEKYRDWADIKLAEGMDIAPDYDEYMKSNPGSRSIESEEEQPSIQ